MTNNKIGDLPLAIRLYLEGELRIEEIYHRCKVGKNRLYAEIDWLGIKRKRQKKREQPVKQELNPRRHERRDCLWFLGCLDKAATADDKCLPCQGCGLYEPGGTADSWQVEVRGGILR